METEDLTGSAARVWVSCVIYAVGMITANYVIGATAIFIFVLDLMLISALWISNLSYRMRFTVLLIAIITLHLSVLFRPENQPFADLWIGGISLILFLTSLFVPRGAVDPSDE